MLKTSNRFELRDQSIISNNSEKIHYRSAFRKADQIALFVEAKQQMIIRSLGIAITTMHSLMMCGVLYGSYIESFFSLLLRFYSKHRCCFALCS